jgi:hypothetical protein
LDTPQRYIPRNWRAKDITNCRFGRLTVLYPIGSKNGELIWYCTCDCGNETRTSGKSMRTGNTLSCGCLHNETLTKRSTTHGRSSTPEYNSWCNMIGRCCNTKHPAFTRYGGRGITVCARWRSSFDAFYQDMGSKPATNYSIERRDNNQSYTPDNCYWASPQSQGRNKRNNRLITYQNRTLPLIAWCAQLQIPYDILRKRLRRGWDVERAFTAPTKHYANA